MSDGAAILDDDALDDLFDELHDDEADDDGSQSLMPPSFPPPAPASRGKGAASTSSVDGSQTHSSAAAPVSHSSSRTGSTQVRMDIVEAKLRAEDGANSDAEDAPQHGHGRTSMKASFGVILRDLDAVNEHARSCMLSDGCMQVLPGTNTSAKVYVCAHPQLARFPRSGKRKAEDLVRALSMKRERRRARVLT